MCSRKPNEKLSLTSSITLRMYVNTLLSFRLEAATLIFK